MKLLVFVLSIIVATSLLIGGGVLVGVTTPRTEGLSPGLVILATLGLSALVFGPLLLGSVTAHWDVTSSDAARRYSRRLTGVVIGLDALGAVAIILYTALTGAPAWMPVIAVAAALLLLGAARLIGPWLLRREEAATESDDEWRSITRREIGRKVVIVAGVFVAVLGLVISVLSVIADRVDTPLSSVRMIGYAVTAASFAGAMAGLIVSLRFNRLLQAAVGRDIGLTQKVARVVLRSKPLVLDDRETVVATKYASVIGVTMSFQLGYLTLLYVAIGLNQLMADNRSRFAVFGIAIPIFLAATLLVIAPLQIVRIVRARRYVAEHAITTDVAQAPDAATEPPQWKP